MSITMITSNKAKFLEIKSVIPHLSHVNHDLPELQEINPTKIVEHKLYSARNLTTEPYIVEDTSLSITALNGLPGPLVKWFLKTIKAYGIYSLLLNSKDKSATAHTVIGFADRNSHFYYFDASIQGKIVPPKGENGFGWDSIFLPNGSIKTFAEMSIEEKTKISMRKLAAEKLKLFLSSQSTKLTDNKI